MNVEGKGPCPFRSYCRRSEPEIDVRDRARRDVRRLLLRRAVRRIGLDRVLARGARRRAHRDRQRTRIRADDRRRGRQRQCIGARVEIRVRRCNLIRQRVHHLQRAQDRIRARRGRAAHHVHRRCGQRDRRGRGRYRRRRVHDDRHRTYDPGRHVVLRDHDVVVAVRRALHERRQHEVAGAVGERALDHVAVLLRVDRRAGFGRRDIAVDRAADDRRRGGHDRLERVRAVAALNDRLARIEVENEIDERVRLHRERRDDLVAALRGARRRERLLGAARRHDRVRKRVALVLREHEAHLLVLAGRQRVPAEVGEYAVGQRQQVDLLRRRERDVGPARIVVACLRTHVDAHLRDGHIDMIKTARRRIRHRDVQRARLPAVVAPAAAAGK
ncbi:hypothetical protein Y023_5119 [Burkholderia pseudomallei A79D]|nr:hypothetical protein Y023_5119 [Burkholderia pseudomallei A79D]KGX97327.1 hypothetical protein X997_4802 [Burkholderia pseudomallei A79C]